MLCLIEFVEYLYSIESPPPQMIARLLSIIYPAVLGPILWTNAVLTLQVTMWATSSDVVHLAQFELRHLNNALAALHKIHRLYGEAERICIQVTGDAMAWVCLW